MNHLKDGTSNPSLSRDTFGLQLFPLPSFDTQKEIVAILKTFDDKIELNRRMNQTLEAIAQAVFKSWFVDFEPVKAKQQAKAAGKSATEVELAAMVALSGKSAAEIEQLSATQRASLADTAALFPERLVESELGLIPEGWKVKYMSELCKIARGASPRPIREYMGGSVPWIKIADATASDSAFIFQTKEFVTEAGASKSIRLQPGTLILSNSATCGIPMFLQLEGCTHDGWLFFENFKHIEKYYLYFALSRLTKKLIQIADGSVQKNLNTKLVSREKIVIPNARLHNVFESLAQESFQKIRLQSLESRTLDQLRNTLLPKLLSGELSIPDAMAQTEEVLS